MNVSTTNTYQNLELQKNVLPLPKPEEPQYSNEDIYEASQGNAIRSDEGELVLTPQGQTNLNEKQANDEASAQAEQEAQREAQRGVATDYIARQSTKSQIEIYLSVATENKVELGENDLANTLETLRDVQQQNKTVEAYATYMENQETNKPELL